MSSSKTNLLFPLDLFYAEEGLALPPVEEVAGESVPEPFRHLLVHRNDMTPTLEAFHGDTIEISVRARHVQEESLSRVVVLSLIESGTPVEYGAIIIHLEHFPPAARALILEGHCPLGTILARHSVVHSGCPQAFVRVQPDAAICAALHISEPRPLYGRRNVLLTSDNAVLADILEILP